MRKIPCLVLGLFLAGSAAMAYEGGLWESNRKVQRNGGGGQQSATGGGPGAAGSQIRANGKCAAPAGAARVSVPPGGSFTSPDGSGTVTQDPSATRNLHGYWWERSDGSTGTCWEVKNGNKASFNGFGTDCSIIVRGGTVTVSNCGNPQGAIGKTGPTIAVFNSGTVTVAGGPTPGAGCDINISRTAGTNTINLNGHANDVDMNGNPRSSVYNNGLRNRVHN